MTVPSPPIFDKLDEMDGFALPPFSLTMTYIYLFGHGGYILLAGIAIWTMRKRFSLFRRVTGNRGTVIVPNSTHVLLLGTVVWSIVDIPYCVLALTWQQGMISNKHWQLVFGCRYVPGMLLAWCLLSATMAIWPFEAQKMRLPWLWNLALIGVPATVITFFMSAICRANNRYSAAWDLHEVFKVQVQATSKSADITPDELSTAVRIGELYQEAIKASMAWAYIAVAWYCFLVISLFIVGVHTLLKLSKEYAKTRESVQARSESMHKSNSAELNRVSCYSQGSAAPLFQFSPTPATDLPLVVEHDSTEPYECLDIEELDASALEPEVTGPKTHFIAFVPPPRPPSPDLAMQKQRQHIAMLAQLRSLLIHTTIQLGCVWGIVSGALIIFSAVLLNFDALLQSSARSARSSILSAVFRPQVIEQVIFLVLGNIYLLSVLSRIRSGTHKASNQVLFPRDDAPADSCAFNVGLFLTSGPAGGADEEAQQQQQQQQQRAPTPVYCFTPRMVNVDATKVVEPARALSLGLGLGPGVDMQQRRSGDALNAAAAAGAAAAAPRASRQARSMETLRMLRRVGSASFGVGGGSGSGGGQHRRLRSSLATVASEPPSSSSHKHSHSHSHSHSHGSAAEKVEAPVVHIHPTAERMPGRPWATSDATPLPSPTSVRCKDRGLATAQDDEAPLVPLRRSRSLQRFVGFVSPKSALQR